MPARQNHGVVVFVRHGREVATWPVTRGDRLDVGVVDQLARLLVVARRHGCSIRLDDASDELLGLLHLCGLAALLGGVERPDP